MKARLFIVLVCCLASLAFSIDIMKLTEIRAGMEGEGRTVFRGTTVETFRFKVLGILENFAPAKNLILAEIFSDELKEGGIVSGMSGSPVYINGKLIGSVSYGFSFAKRPIAGITPIEDILKIDQYNSPAPTIDISSIKLDFDRQNVKHIADLLQSELVRRVSSSPSNLLTPIGLRASSSGFRTEALNLFLPVFSLSQDLKISTQLSKKNR